MTTRRTFLQLAVVATSFACTPPSTGAGEGEAGEGEGEGEGEGDGVDGRDMGPASSFGTGINQVPNTGILVCKDADGLYAMSGICTHLGCDLSGPNGFLLSGGTIQCGCHHSIFDKNGNVVQGPAGFPLKHFAVTVKNGEVFVNANDVVSGSTRV